MTSPFALGLDVGAASVAAVLLEDGLVVARTWRPHGGDLEGTLSLVLADLPAVGPAHLGVTGARASALAFPPGHDRSSEVVCAVEASRRVAPGARGVLLVGGERSAFVELDGAGRYVAHRASDGCGCGTGAFLEEQAARLGMTLGELARAASDNEDEPPLLASRCAVFGRSDVVHLLQDGVSLSAVSAGLCETVAAGLRERLLSAPRPMGPLAFLGGPALLAPLRRAVERAFGLDLLPVEAPESAVALGAAWLGRRREALDAPLARLAPGRRAAKGWARAGHDPAEGGGAPRRAAERVDPVGALRVERYGDPGGPLGLGLDVGARTTKAMLIGADGEPVAGLSVGTSGRPIRSAQRLLGAVAELLGEDGTARVVSVGVTGSGRELVARAIGADRVLNEVSAHARGALRFDPGADTVFEIGGQDAKFMRLADGTATVISLSAGCAAGTGGFLEEQARRLGVGIEAYDGLLPCPPELSASQRCTLFMERDVDRLLAEGRSVPEALAAAVRSVCESYFAKVVGARPVGRRVVVQGGTARNSALVAAFEARLGRAVTVSPLCHLGGALGAALAARDAQTGPTRFKGLSVAASVVASGHERCEACESRCLLTTLTVDGVTTGWGMACGRDFEHRPPEGSRQTRCASRPGPDRTGRPPRIGVPRQLELLTSFGLWRDLLEAVGFEVLTAAPSVEALVAGRRLVGPSTCAPSALYLGQALDLLERGCDALFVPTLVRGPAARRGGDQRVSRQRTDAYYCFLSQYLPAILGSGRYADRARLVSPLLSLNEGEARTAAALAEALSSVRPSPPSLVLRAYRAALRADHRRAASRRERGAATLVAARQRGEAVVAVLGMPYALREAALGLDLPAALERLGQRVLVQDMLPCDPARLSAGLEDDGTHWQHGKEILGAVRWIAREESVYPVLLTPSHCAPSALLAPRLREAVEDAGRPHLVLEVDPQASAVGLVTRLEAAVESFRDHHERRSARPARRTRPAPRRRDLPRMSRRLTFLVPRIDDLLRRLWQAALEGGGYGVRFFEQSPAALAEGQQLGEDGECLAIPSIVGGAARELRGSGARGRAVFVPTSSYACAYPEFARSIRRGLDRAGLTEVPLYAPNLFAPFPGVSAAVNAAIWESVVAADALRRAALETRPAEVDRGATDRVVDRALLEAEGALRRGRGPGPAVAAALRLLAEVDVDRIDRPRVLVVGTMFLRFNPLLTDGLIGRVEALGGRVLTTPTSDYTLTARLQDRRLMQLGGAPLWWRAENALLLGAIRARVRRYERLPFEDSRNGRPSVGAAPAPFDDLEHHVARGLGIPWALGGETLSVLGRVLQAVRRREADAVVHVGTLACQPAQVSAAILEPVLRRAGVPMLSLTFDGSTEAGPPIEPLLHFLGGARRDALETRAS